MMPETKSHMPKTSREKDYNHITIAVPNKGRLNKPALELLANAGLHIIDESSRKLFARCTNPSVSILFARASDIPEYVAMGAADMGMTGYDLVCEKEIDVEILMDLGFGSADLVLAVPEDMHMSSVQQLDGKKVATSYPKITKSFFAKKGMNVEIVEVSGACEMTPHVGIADAIVDLSSSGTTLKINHLQVIEHVLASSVKLIANKESSSHRGHIMDDVVMAFKSVIDAQNKRYLMMNVPKDALDAVKKILPGMSGPTVMPVEASENLVAVHAVVDEMDIFRIITSLKRAGARDILITPIERLIK